MTTHTLTSVTMRGDSCLYLMITLGLTSQNSMEIEFR